MHNIGICLSLMFFLFSTELFIWLDKFDELPDSAELFVLWLSAAVQTFVILVLAKLVGWLK